MQAIEGKYFIRNPRKAFEMVKANKWDSDAGEVRVRLVNGMNGGTVAYQMRKRFTGSRRIRAYAVVHPDSSVRRADIRFESTY